MRVHIHIGFHKTGTTAMQELLVANAPLLPYTKVLGRHAPEVERLRAALIAFNRTGFQKEAEIVIREASELIEREDGTGVDTLILASAGVSGSIPDPSSKEPPYLRTHKAVQLLVEAVSGKCELTFSASTRSEEQWLDSLHRHHLRFRGIRKRLEDLKAGPLGQFRFSGQIELIRRSVPHLFVFKMEDDASSNLGIGESLAIYLGVRELDLKAWTPAKDFNRGISRASADALSTQFLRLLPRFIRKRIARLYTKWN